MCGIAGIIYKDQSKVVTSAILSRATDMLSKRGPDDAGAWTEGNAGLGHRRLSILDLTPSGHQPMFSADDRYVAVYNGEIYNFAELRREFGPAAQWKSDSDTEVLIAAYAAMGAACLNRFHGMFAFAIWDRHKKVLFAARDRMGVKPFYYHHSALGFAFASRPRALFRLLPDLAGKIDEQALRFYLEVGYVPAPFSIHESIRKLPPAHYLLLDENELHVARYWDFRSIQPDVSWLKRPEEDLLDELDEIISRSVKARMISDVPLGAFLSGGIDSSLVVAMMARHSQHPVKTFTIGFSEKEYDESNHAKAVADYLGTEHFCEYLSVNDLLQLMPTFYGEFDEPFYDSSAFPLMAVSRLARRHVTVSLSGDGGDELFGGYHYYQIAARLQPFFALPANFRKCIALLVGMLPQHRLKLLSAALGQTDQLASFAFSRSIAKDFNRVLHQEAIDRTVGVEQLFRAAAGFFPAGISAGEQGMRLDALYTLPDEYLQKMDVASMAFSLEARDPLLDQDIVEWAMKLPESWKLRGNVNKYLLRKLAYRYVPREILDRPKQGFNVPIDRWLRGPLKDWAEERLHDQSLFDNSPLDQQAVKSLWQMHCSGRRNVHPLLWAVLMFLDFNNKSLS